MARLATEDHSVMTAAANASPRHPARLDGWRQLVAAAAPGLAAPDVDEGARRARSAHFAALGRRSGESRRGGTR